MNAHTPGPWRAFDKAGANMQHYSQSSGVHGVGEHAQKIICGCFHDIGGPDVASANALLIAAAPEMFACLREISEQNFVSGLAIGNRIDALLATIDGSTTGAPAGTPAGTPDPEQPTKERIRECLEACKDFDNPVEAVRDLIEGFFEGQGEPTRDESAHYMTVRDQDTKSTATLIISNTSPDVAQRISDCVNACKDLKEPIVAVAFLSRLPEVLRICENCLSQIPNKTAFETDTLALIKTALIK